MSQDCTNHAVAWIDLALHFLQFSKNLFPVEQFKQFCTKMTTIDRQYIEIYCKWIFNSKVILTLTVPVTSRTSDILKYVLFYFILFFFSEKNNVLHFMWIVCYILCRRFTWNVKPCFLRQAIRGCPALPNAAQVSASSKRLLSYYSDSVTPTHKTHVIGTW